MCIIHAVFIHPYYTNSLTYTAQVIHIVVFVHGWRQMEACLSEFCLWKMSWLFTVNSFRGSDLDPCCTHLKQVTEWWFNLNVLPADKLAFVGFKGSFHPDWVHLEVDTDRAKVHQVMPIPVVHKMKLWVAGRVGRTAKRLCSLRYWLTYTPSK